MHVLSQTYSSQSNFLESQPQSSHYTPQLVIYTGHWRIIEKFDFKILRQYYPNAAIIGYNKEFKDETIKSEDALTINAYDFTKTQLRFVAVRLSSKDHSFEAGNKIINFLATTPGLQNILIIGDDNPLDKQEFLSGLTNQISAKITVYGKTLEPLDNCKTIVGCNFAPEEKQIIGIGFCGDEFPLRDDFQPWIDSNKQLLN